MKWSILALALVIGTARWAAADDDRDFRFGPSKVRFLGKSPNFQIQPNANLSSYLQMRFSKFEERDSSGNKVQKHALESIASAGPIWTEGNATNSDGTNYTYVRMSVDPTTRNGFDATCTSGNGNGGGNGGRRLMLGMADSSRRHLTAAGAGSGVYWVNVTVYFGFDQNTSFPYGFNKSVSVGKGGIKFSVEANWPFCAAGNTLHMEIDLLLKNNGTAQANVSSGNNGAKILSLPLGENTTANVSFANYAYEAVNGNRSMTVGVELDTSGSKSTVALTLPNPTPDSKIYYDPTVTTSYDSGSGSSGTSGNSGSSSAVRLTAWSILATAFLSALLLA